MKKVFNCLVTIALILFLSRCSSGGMDNESNNEIHQAAEVTLGEPFEIKIDPKADIDWFKVNVSEKGYILVQANNIDETISPEVKFALFQEWESNKEKVLKDWTKPTAILHVAEAGTYHFAIADDWNDASSSKPLSIKVDFVPEMDEFELNDKFEDAKELTAEQVIKLFIYPEKDIDWFKFNAQKRGYLKAMCRNTVEGITPEVKFIKINPDSNEKTELTGWSPLPASCFIADSGIVYVMVHDDWDDKGVNSPLEFRFDFLNDFDITEPNEKYTQAAEVKSGDTLNLAIFPKGDIDLYKIATEKKNKIKFTGKDWEDVITPELRLYTLDTVSNELKEHSDWKKLPAEFDVTPNEVFYVKIHDDWDDKCSEKPFKIIIN